MLFRTETNKLFVAIQHVHVAGAGTMGSGIALVAALAGFKVSLADLNGKTLETGLLSIEENLKKAVEKGKISAEQKQTALQNIRTGNALPDAETDLVIEVIVEKLEVKQAFFGQVESAVAETCLIVSNTSSLSIDALAADLKHKSRFAGLHFFNPANLMQLVEVVQGSATSSQTLEGLVDFCLRCNKKPVICKDSPGFIVNRVARPFYTEALYILENDHADMETIDAMAVQTGFKMGPFTLMDLIGNDVNFAVTTSVYEGMNKPERFKPSTIQQQKVISGKLGKKTGKGFYNY